MFLNQFKQSMIGAGFMTSIICLTPPQVMSLPVHAQAFKLSDSAKQTILEEHNKYRAAVNTPSLEWSSQLENDAKQWAVYLAKRGGRKLIHADLKTRKGQGENLWMGASGRFSYSNMVATWAHERKLFKPGVFPNVSSNGNWFSVSHYTQVVWKNTTQLGCAQARAGGHDLLVCRYNPAGNISGQKVF